MRIDALTSLRFLAAIIVVFSHFGGNVSYIKALPYSLRNGSVMVTFFFVLSGFVIAIANRNKDINIAEFYIKRIFRISPSYFFSIFLGVYVFYGALNTLELLSISTFMLAWFPALPDQINGPAWSVSVEAFFYVVFPALFVFTKNIKSFVYSSLAAWLITQLVHINIINAESINTNWPSIGFSLVYYFPISHINSFMIGIATGCLHSDYKDRISSDGFLSLATCVFSVVFVSYIICNIHSWEHVIGFKLPAEASLLSPMFAALIFIFSVSRNILIDIISMRAFVFLGEISYSVYILQLPLYLFCYKNIFPYFSMPDDYDFLLYISLLIIISSLAYVFLEKTSMKLSKIICEKIRSRAVSVYA